MTARFVRLAETGRATFDITIDGVVHQACVGDTLIVALLTNVRGVRDAEFDSGLDPAMGNALDAMFDSAADADGGATVKSRRAGFCMMGACQDCWVWTASGERLRACTTPAEPGMSVVTSFVTVADMEGVWPAA